MGARNSLRADKHFWTGRMFTPLEAVVALTLTTNADRAGVWGSPLRQDLTTRAQYPSPLLSLHPATCWSMTHRNKER